MDADWAVPGSFPHRCFVARTGLVSLMSAPPGEVPLPDFAKLPPFVSRCVTADIRKTALATVAAFRPDILVLDFIDERFDILRQGEACITKSLDFVTAGGLGWAKHAELVDRAAEATTLLWTAAAGRFVTALRTTDGLKGAKVVLHRAPWARIMVAGGDLGGPVERGAATVAIGDGKHVDVARYGVLATKYYDIFAALMPECVQLTVPEKYHFGATKHRWGPAPFHYVTGYYRALVEALGRV